MENRFAAARRRYLRTHMDGIYTGMLLTGTLEPHLKEIGEAAQAMFDRLVEQMKKPKDDLIYNYGRSAKRKAQSYGHKALI